VLEHWGIQILAIGNWVGNRWSILFGITTLDVQVLLLLGIRIPIGILACAPNSQIFRHVVPIPCSRFGKCLGRFVSMAHGTDDIFLDVSGSLRAQSIVPERHAAGEVLGTHGPRRGLPVTNGMGSNKVAPAKPNCCGEAAPPSIRGKSGTCHK
jgi:hypothetical protein